MDVNLAVVGLGRVGSIHARNSFKANGINLKCLVDADLGKAEEFAKELSCRASSDFQLVLDDPEINAVLVGTPTLTHYDYVKRALLSGKDVFAEKPLGVDIDQIDECYRLAEAGGKILFLAFQRRFDPAFGELIQADRSQKPDCLRHAQKQFPLCAPATELPLNCRTRPYRLFSICLAVSIDAAILYAVSYTHLTLPTSDLV